MSLPDQVLEAIPEFKEKFNITIEMINNYIRNFNEISKQKKGKIM